MESLALLVTLIVLGRIAFVSLCVALVIYYLNWKYVDGILQARSGFPTHPLFIFSLMFVIGILITLLLGFIR
jgi:uncharacterized membrane protein